MFLSCNILSFRGPHHTRPEMNITNKPICEKGAEEIFIGSEDPDAVLISCQSLFSELL